MAKAKNQSSKITRAKIPVKNESNNFLSFFDENKPIVTYVMLGIIVAAIMIFFSNGIFSGKIFASADNLSPMSFKTFLDDAKAKGIYPLWIPYIFMGMPSLASMTAAIPSMHNFYSFIWDKFFEAFSGGNLFFLTLPYYFIFAITLFFYARYKFRNNLIALFSALLGVFATGIIQLIIVGHHTKMMTFAFFPLILLIIEKIADKEEKTYYKIFFYFAILSILLYLQLHFHHIQMLFYSFMMIGIYLGYMLIAALIKKANKSNIIKAVIIFFAALIIAVAMDADIILSIKEYSKYSMRGQPSITTINDNSQADKPLSYDYATSWSFSPGEVMTFVLPYYYGFGNVEVNGQRTNLYWGQMPFTDSPVYFGVIVFMLAIIGIIYNYKKNIFVQATALIILFFLLLSFGKNMPLIYDLFYNHMPFFSSFRAPVMIHYYIDLAFIFLAGYGLLSLINLFGEENGQQRLTKAVYVIGGIGILMFMISVIGFQDSYSNSILTSDFAQKYISQGYSVQQINGYLKQQVIPNAYDNIISDLRLHSLLIIVIAVLIYFYSKRNISRNLLITGIIIISLFDLLSVSAKTLHWDDKKQKDDFIKETDITKFILNKEPDTYNYRVAQMKQGQLITSNDLAYFRLHQFNGYQGAKLRIYQDAVDVAGGNNPFLLGLNNVKYVINDTPLQDTNIYKEVYKGSAIVYQNMLSMPRAFFVDEVKTESGMNILNNIKNISFDPHKTAFTEKNLTGNIEKPDSTVYAKITSFDINNIEYDVNASGNNLLVLNEMYYPAGWKAFVDGQETEIYKTNYIQRSVIVPEGKHKIEMKFHPDTYYTGKKISIAANIIVTLILIGGIYGIFIERKKLNKKSENN